MKATLCAAAMAAALSSAASASEPTIVWRSATSGVLTAPAPADEAPATPPVASFTVIYGQNRFTWSTGESVLLMPDVSGGSGRYEYSLATGDRATAVARIAVVR